jgi:hypothetical protein
MTYNLDTDEKVLLKSHYYGDTTRILFVVGGLIMVVFFPFFKSIMNIPTAFSIIGLILLIVFAGLMNPKLKIIIFMNMIISIGAFAFFEYSAVFAYLTLPPSEGINVLFFWVNQFLSLIFFFASYLSTKTFRGMLIPE